MCVAMFVPPFGANVLLCTLIARPSVHAERHCVQNTSWHRDAEIIKRDNSSATGNVATRRLLPSSRAPFPAQEETLAGLGRLLLRLRALRGRRGVRVRVLFVVLLLAGVGQVSCAAHAEEGVLALSIGPESRRYTAAQLLARPDATELTIPADVSYGQSMRYRAVPLLSLVSVGPAFDTIEARAVDGFVSQI